MKSQITEPFGKLNLITKPQLIENTMSWSRTLLNCHMFPNSSQIFKNLKIARWKAPWDCGLQAYQNIHFLFTLRDPKTFGSLADLFIPLPVNFVYFQFTSRPTIAQCSFDISKCLLLVAFFPNLSPRSNHYNHVCQTAVVCLCRIYNVPQSKRVAS